MEAFIELVCRAHPSGDGPGPLITPVDQKWAYCEGHAQGDHEWMRIEPTPREYVGDLSQTQARRAS
jgi:hypothetical protein